MMQHDLDKSAKVNYQLEKSNAKLKEELAVKKKEVTSKSKESKESEKQLMQQYEEEVLKWRTKAEEMETTTIPSLESARDAAIQESARRDEKLQQIDETLQARLKELKDVEKKLQQKGTESDKITKEKEALAKKLEATSKDLEKERAAYKQLLSEPKAVDQVMEHENATLKDQMKELELKIAETEKATALQVASALERYHVSLWLDTYVRKINRSCLSFLLYLTSFIHSNASLYVDMDFMS
jgi:hypothetical protein